MHKNMFVRKSALSYPLEEAQTALYAHWEHCRVAIAVQRLLLLCVVQLCHHAHPSFAGVERQCFSQILSTADANLP